MQIVTLKVIPKRSAGVILNTGPTPEIFNGKGPVTLLCGGCNAVLCRNVERGQIQNLCLECNRCDSFNDSGNCGAVVH
jgi:hypothetical protein